MQQINLINDLKKKGDKESILNHSNIDFDFDFQISAASEYYFLIAFCALRLFIDLFGVT